MTIEELIQLLERMRDMYGPNIEVIKTFKSPFSGETVKVKIDDVQTIKGKIDIYVGL